MPARPSRHSSHLSKLEAAGLALIEKVFENKHPVTCIALTLEGREGLNDHWSRLEAIRRGAKALKSLRAT